MTPIDDTRADRIGVVDHSSGRLGRAVEFLRAKGPLEVLRLLRQHGIAGSANFVSRNLRHMIAHWHAKRFDRRYGVDTAGSIQLDGLDVTGPNKSLGNECVCTSPRSFHWLMRRVDISGETTFIDIGAGKSRTLLLASMQKFRRVIGVEFARELVDISRRNIDVFQPSLRQVASVEIVLADAGAYDFPPEPLLVYLYNPFSADLLERVMGNLAASLKRHPRPCQIVYTTGKGTLPWAMKSIVDAGPFILLESGKTPPFLDAVRTMDYAIFRVAEPSDS